MSHVLSPADVRLRISDAMHPANFFVAPNLRFEWEIMPSEEVAWEIFQGRLLDASQTRERRSFESWNVFAHDEQGQSAEPLVSVKLDAASGQVYVIRAVHSYAWEGYHAGDNVYLSREVKKWLRELVGTIDLSTLTGTEALSEALASQLTQAVFGTSRLPLTSLEAPVPAFTLGQLAYLPGLEAARGSLPAKTMSSQSGLLSRGLEAAHPWSLKAKLLETLLRSTPSAAITDAADRFVSRWREIGQSTDELGALFHTMFEDVALSPYTDFVEKTLAFLQALEERGDWSAEAHADFLGRLLRQLVRHLTAFDLHTFHHRGANYPDALLLDAALKSLLSIGERKPDLFLATAHKARLRRRALRQACLLRLWYEGLPVPDQPTSPGENSRVLPSQFPRIPEEQIIDPTKRTRKLYDNDPLLPRLSDFARDVLRNSLRDLEDVTELHELGMALFLDRPLGVFKRPGEPDDTPLLSYEACSRTIAGRRLKFLAERLSALAAPGDWARWDALVHSGPAITGVPLHLSPALPRPGVASLNDAFKVANDYILLRTTRRAARDFLSRFDFAALESRTRLDFLASDRRLLIVVGAAVGRSPGTLIIFDDALQPRLELEIDSVPGLRVRRSWDTEAGGVVTERDLTSENLRLGPTET